MSHCTRKEEEVESDNDDASEQVAQEVHVALLLFVIVGVVAAADLDAIVLFLMVVLAEDKGSVEQDQANGSAENEPAADDGTGATTLAIIAEPNCDEDESNEVSEKEQSHDEGVPPWQENVEVNEDDVGEDDQEQDPENCSVPRHGGRQLAAAVTGWRLILLRFLLLFFFLLGHHLLFFGFGLGLVVFWRCLGGVCRATFEFVPTQEWLAFFITAVSLISLALLSLGALFRLAYGPLIFLNH